MIGQYRQLLPIRIATFKSVVDYRDESLAALSGSIKETYPKMILSKSSQLSSMAKAAEM